MSIYVLPMDPSRDCDNIDAATISVISVAQCKPSTVLTWMSMSAKREVLPWPGEEKQVYKTNSWKD